MHLDTEDAKLQPIGSAKARGPARGNTRRKPWRTETDLPVDSELGIRFLTPWLYAQPLGELWNP